MSKREKTTVEIEHEFDSAEVPSANIKAMRPFSELLEKKTHGPSTQGQPESACDKPLRR
ncbi:hypothetical protein SBC1_37580 (plasmid) [Caballeronia sp. SBC1]|uniref:hypothetical protein n=1 Tax=unclassified Caballeronia TaxID=2646786 RepID=UPI0013E165C8|nr:MULTISPECIES: hypothetical protein [unclassified Caballeronia]QIE26966.1 hypothetical protein SBC2_50360 [Caballeronia sp. SBC2]QIN63718.1 hypothetical protein SBC1_37580 [Caballeronia sp. SBC1]